MLTLTTYCRLIHPLSEHHSGLHPVSAALKTFMPRSDKVEAVQVHDLVPGGDEVAHELLLRVVLRGGYGLFYDLGYGFSGNAFSTSRAKASSPPCF